MTRAERTRLAQNAHMIAAINVYAELVGHAINCHDGCRVTKNQVFASIYCRDGYNLATEYQRLAPYCCSNTTPGA